MGYDVAPEAQRANHLFGIRVPDGLTRDGRTMEQILQQLKINRVNVSTRGNAIRVSPHVYNTEKDMRRLAAALKAAISK